MGQRVVLQKDGRFAVWSGVVDAYIILDATEEELRAEFDRVALEDQKRVTDRAIAQARGEIPRLHGGSEPHYPPEEAEQHQDVDE